MNLTEEEQEEKEKVWFSVKTWQFSFRFHVICVLLVAFISYCPSLHSNVTARNLCINFVALTSSRNQAVVYICVRLYWQCIAIAFCFCFYCSITIFVVLYYHMWWIKIFICSNSLFVVTVTFRGYKWCSVSLCLWSGLARPGQEPIVTSQNYPDF